MSSYKSSMIVLENRSNSLLISTHEDKLFTVSPCEALFYGVIHKWIWRFRKAHTQDHMIEIALVDTSVISAGRDRRTDGRLQFSWRREVVEKALLDGEFALW